MLTEKQIASNRLNALKSTGPRTEEGKQRSSLNACRHNLTGHVQCISEDDQLAFDNHCSAMVAALKPEGVIENDLAMAVAVDRWRLNRVRALENNLFALGHERPGGLDAGHPQLNSALDQAQTWLIDAKQFQLLSLYETRIHRSIEKSNAQLEALQATREAARIKAFEEATDLAILNIMEGKEVDPADLRLTPGFVFSVEEIRRHVNHQERLRRARHYKRLARDTKREYPDPKLTYPAAA